MYARLDSSQDLGLLYDAFGFTDEKLYGAPPVPNDFSTSTRASYGYLFFLMTQPVVKTVNEQKPFGRKQFRCLTYVK